MDLLMNVLLNVFEFLGIEQANQIIVVIMIMALGLMYKLSEMAKWVVGVFLVVMVVSLATAIYQIAYGARAQCVFAYDDAKPVFKDSATRKLQWAEMRELNCPTLWVARNEIFHRDGYCFYTPLGFSYFESGRASCSPDVEAPKSEIALHNARVLGRLERRKGCRVPPASCRDFSRVSSSRLVLRRGPLKAQ